MEDDIEKTKFSNNQFDLILCSEVLEHLFDPETSIRKISNILKPGGFAIITTPQKYSLMEILCKIAFLPIIIYFVSMIYIEPILKAGHISLRTDKQIKLEFARNNLKIIKNKKIGLYIPILAEISDGVLIHKIEKIIQRNIYFHWLLWTQCYIVKKVAKSN
jgi:SAM-dependent methyltransferase